MTEDEAAELAEKSGMMRAFTTAVDAALVAGDRIRYGTEDGALDDLLVSNATIHIERMPANQYSILITSGDRAIHLTGRKVCLGWQHDLRNTASEGSATTTPHQSYHPERDGHLGTVRLASVPTPSVDSPPTEHESQGSSTGVE